MTDTNSSAELTLVPINESNWRKVVRVRVKSTQTDFVAETSYYLLLCHYRELWQPLAISVGDQVIGFIMWAIDHNDGSCWLGGFHIDAEWQGKGFGKKTIKAIIENITNQYKINNFALSVQPQNPACSLYEALGFMKTDEWEDDEIVMRYSVLQF
ncbi:MAG: GNAT family N-acetyltransferase [Anaerolineaceae bacterium]|nr:GNAT family N-acetyltransferase [Anaerolineaceae bacterium]